MDRSVIKALAVSGITNQDFFFSASEKMLKAWKEMEEKAIHYAEVKITELTLCAY